MPVDPTLPPSDPPRPLTPRAARAAWTEPAVRLWWLVAATVLVLILAYAAQRLWVRHGENRLITAGVPVAARVLGTPDHQTPGQTASAGDAATVEFDWHGRPVRPTGLLAVSTRVGATIPVHVDPDDPTVWTDRTTPTPLADVLFVGLLLLPIVPALAAVAAWKRRGVARTYRLGRPAAAVVADRRQTPIAPLSYAVRCSLREGDRRLRTVYVPRAGRSLVKGDTLWLLLPTGRGRPVAAMWFGASLPPRHGGTEKPDREDQS